jgi:hypothetical protein
MTNAQPLPEWIQQRTFTLKESDECGVKRRRTTGRELHTPSRSIRVPWGIEQDVDGRIRPILAVTPGGIASHSTAAMLWEIPLPPWIAGSFAVHVSRIAAKSPPWRTGVTGHHTRFKAGDVVNLRGMPVTSPLRTWLDLAAMLDLDDLVAAGDFLVCEHNRSFGPPRVPLVALTAIKEAVKHEFHRRGIVIAREAAELIKVGADSPPETRIRLALERAGLPAATLNYVVEDATGQDASWPDLAFPRWQVAIEYDGEHHLGERQRGIDAARDRLMEQLGWRQLRITKAMLDADGDKAVIALVKKALRAQGWTGRLAPR